MTFLKSTIWRWISLLKTWIAWEPALVQQFAPVTRHEITNIGILLRLLLCYCDLVLKAMFYQIQITHGTKTKTKTKTIFNNLATLFPMTGARRSKRMDAAALNKPCDRLLQSFPVSLLYYVNYIFECN